MERAEHVEILLIEDDPGDVELTREVMKNSKLLVRLNIVSDGEEALKYLRRKDGYEDKQRPDLVLLDLNLPKVDGREVLQVIKADRELRMIPVVVLTTSTDEQDVIESYGLGANCYVSKPLGMAEFSAIVRSIEEFWFTIVKLPHGH